MTSNILTHLTWYLDLDGVFADFDKKFTGTYLKPFRDFEDDEAWEKLKAIPNFWLHLEPMPGAHKLWFFLKNQGISPVFLSSPGSHDEPRARYQKRLWLDAHFGSDTPLILKRRSQKQLFAAPDSVLIDDWVPNIEEWRARGGIAIQHTSVEDTLFEIGKISTNSVYLEQLRKYWAAEAS